MRQHRVHTGRVVGRREAGYRVKVMRVLFNVNILLIFFVCMFFKFKALTFLVVVVCS